MFGLSYLRLAAYAALCAVVLGAFLYVRHLQTENERLTHEAGRLTVELSLQNQAIQVLKKDAEQRVKDAEEALRKQKMLTDAAKKRATVIYKAEPANKGDLCTSALELVNEIR